MRIIKMSFPNVHDSMTRPNTSEYLAEVLQKIGSSVTINQAAAEFLERFLNGKNLPPVVETEWSGPLCKNFGIEWFYMDWEITKDGGMIRIDNDAVAVSVIT